MTYGEFQKLWSSGKIEIYDKKTQYGYVSRKLKIEQVLDVRIAGGVRAGEKYVLMPRWDSTQFCTRLYFREVVKK